MIYETVTGIDQLLDRVRSYQPEADLSLVRKALMERELLLRSAPHIMWPLRFVLPHDAGTDGMVVLRYRRTS